MFTGEERHSGAEEQNPKGFSLTVGLPFSGRNCKIIYWWDHKMNHKEGAAHKGFSYCCLRMWPFSYSNNNNRRQSWASRDIPLQLLQWPCKELLLGKAFFFLPEAFSTEVYSISRSLVALLLHFLCLWLTCLHTNALDFLSHSNFRRNEISKYLHLHS